jgi:uncharacterized membrane protein HdeD (DUF308 family)
VTLLILGILGAAVGVAHLLDFTSTLILGPLVLTSSMVQMLVATFAEVRKERVLHFVAAGIEFLLGFAIMIHPPERVIGLAALVGIIFLFIGLARLARSLFTPTRGRVWAITTGVVALLAGAAALFGGSVAKLAVVGLCIAFDFLCHGAVWYMVAQTGPWSDEGAVGSEGRAEPASSKP